MMRVADYIMECLAGFGVQDIFMITGGGAMHLNDAAGRRFRYICNHHEQAAAIAAEGYARATGNPAVVLVTTGPGGLNTLTGVMGQWTDSVPVIYISGQVKFSTTIRSCPELSLRQLGDQEVNIVEVVRPLTKSAVCVTDPSDIRRALEHAWHTSITGRPGPVWLDIPMNVQGAIVDVAALPRFVPPVEPLFDQENALGQIRLVTGLLARARRPVLVAGHGIRLAGARNSLLELLEKIPLPVLSTFNGFDLVPTDHPCFAGRIGTIGDRGGNFALQNADLIISVGSRNNIRQISYGWENTGRNARKVVVDIDAAELNKPTFRGDELIHADAGFFLDNILPLNADIPRGAFQEWLSWCRQRQEKYPVVAVETAYPEKPVNPYLFARILSEELPPDSMVVTSNATANIVYFQGGLVKEGQRVIWNSGCASMGYDLPAAIGACVARGGRKVICLAGDGSLMMNLQELATIVHYRLPIAIFLFNNSGYVSIRQTQSGFFGSLFGCDSATGVGFPDLVRVAEAFGIRGMRVEGHAGMRQVIREILDSDEPQFCELILDPAHTIEPKLSSVRLADGTIVSKPLEDMSPLLERGDFLANMLNPPVDE